MTSDPRQHYRRPYLDTPLHARTEAASQLADWAPWAGYRTVHRYSDEAMEYSAIRNAASLYDLSPMVKYRIEGRGAAACLDRLTLRSATGQPEMTVRYTGWCDDAGKLMDDGTLFRLGPDEFRLCCQERHLPWLLDSAEGFDVAVSDVSEAEAGIALQGPCAWSVLNAAGLDAGGLKPFAMMPGRVGGRDLLVSRTGFTGDLGYEIWMASGDALAVWDALAEAGRPWGIRPVGSAALNLARLEAGFITANVDFVPAEQALREDRVRSPLELGLGWMIDWQKPNFNGRRALMAERDGNSSVWSLVALDLEGNVPAEGSLIYHNRKREVGFITSAAWSPVTKRNIALAHVRRPFDGGEAAANLWAEVYAMRELQYVKLMLRATPCERPFFAPARRRATPPPAF